MIEKLLDLVRMETEGDPMGGLLWTYRSLSKLAAAISDSGVKVSANTVRKWLGSCNYSRHVNRKTIGGTVPPGRDEQFRRIAALRDQCEEEGIPIVSGVLFRAQS
ncbi:MAG: hypothetical protein OXN89_08095 [Bryobacterales bacterium]|nr:hypothetical protein [Bryobacterales bacterium]